MRVGLILFLYLHIINIITLLHLHVNDEWGGRMLAVSVIDAFHVQLILCSGECFVLILNLFGISEDPAEKCIILAKV